MYQEVNGLYCNFGIYYNTLCTSSYKYISSSVDLTLLEWALGQLDKTYQMDELHVLLLWKTYIVRYSRVQNSIEKLVCMY